MALIPTELDDSKISNTTIHSNCSGSFKCVNQGELYIGQGSVTVNTELPAYSPIISGLPFSTTPYLNVFVIGIDYNRLYCQNGTIVNRDVIPAGTELRVSIFGILPF